jgi:NAD(P)-dependent dehydrogenase (short-subunit alcohol dehydrogenase family)
MPALSVVEASNSKYAPSYLPTAVFVGGTSGIGRAMAEAFAAQTKGRANIILIGRNKAPADETIAGFPTIPSELESTVKHEFVQCDASEMKNVHNICQELLSRIDKINILVLSIGGVAFRRKDTAEGLDTSMVLRYYCRAKFITELLPLLSKAKAAGEDARVLSILGAAKGREVDLEDPGLQNWSSGRAMSTTATYNDIMIKVRGFSFLHGRRPMIHVGSQ